MRELLRQAEEQLHASRQQAALLAAELRDAAGARDHSMGELYQARLEVERLAASLAEAQAEGRRLEGRLERLQSVATSHKDVVSKAAAKAPPGGPCALCPLPVSTCTHRHRLLPSQGVATVGEGAGPSEVEAELQREVEELKLRLHMAAEHYKEKYRECQRLRKQVAKLTSGEAVSTEM